MVFGELNGHPCRMREDQIATIAGVWRFVDLSWNSKHVHFLEQSGCRMENVAEFANIIF
jgi:hypothetical protein